MSFLSDAWGQRLIEYTRSNELVEMGSHARYFEDTTDQLTHQQVSRLPHKQYADSPDKVSIKP